ncbi:MAG TPA: hypothetical protein VGN72_15690 [Tepidisphaeraceae bacterium]|jgi:hypothetical protein|nr:hypothetical protein [Tepidisphaeraceae bacterium]
MGKTYLPVKDAEFHTFAGGLVAAVAADYAALGVPQALADRMAAEYAAFDERYARSNNPETRGRATIERRRIGRAVLTRTIREAVGMIKANPPVTASQLYDLGLNERADAVRRSVMAPIDSAPALTVAEVEGHRVTVTLGDVASPKKRAKPESADGAVILMHIGPTPPADLGEWRFAALTGLTQVDIDVPASAAPGAIVWLSAQWFDGRKRMSAACHPIFTHVQHGGSLRIAA